MLGYLQEKTKANIYGFDYSENAVNIAKQLFQNNADFRLGIIGEMYNSENTTSRKHMEDLIDDDKFFVNGEEHTVEDAHYSGDASYDGYIIYDEEGEEFFSEDFPTTASSTMICDRALFEFNLL